MSSTLHPDGKLHSNLAVCQSCNDSGNDNMLDLVEQRMLSRRGFLKGSAGATAMAVLGTGMVDSLSNYAEAAPPPLGPIGFNPVDANIQPMVDAVTVPAGYTAKLLVAWGDSLTTAPHWNPTGAMDEATQLHCYGAHTDGMHFFPFPEVAASGQSGTRGLLVTNSEYVDPPLVNNIKPAADYARAAITLPMVRAQQAAHGVNILEVQQTNGVWSVIRTSPLNRRITGNTPCKISGPAAGSDQLKSFKFDMATGQQVGINSGFEANGTLNNCAHGYTPWGTYLTCEENWNGYFAAPTKGAGIDKTLFDQKADIIQGQSRYGIASTSGYRWHLADARFNADTNPLEPHLFGWVVEIDPWNPGGMPVKRTALGRFKHEGAQLVVDKNDRVAFYMGDDERNEYVYKFVCANALNRDNRAANRDMLDHGTLYVAKFNVDGSGLWLPLVWGRNGLTEANGFKDQADVLIRCRQAADRLGATMMDRPEWGAAHPVTGEIYMTMTNNSRRGNNPVSSNKVDGTSNAASANPAIDAANPRPDNTYGHIIRWRDGAWTDGRTDVTATSFVWDLFVQCGDKSTTKIRGASYNPAEFGGQGVGYQGNVNGNDYGAPDGLWFDKDGRLWIQTDQQGDAKGDWVNIGGNVMMCADPSTGSTKRFLTSPKYCEVTGVVTTPDGKTMFVGIQHPGEDWKTEFTDHSTWPDSGVNGPTTNSGRPQVYKPRSGVVVITKHDGGVIGT